MVEKVFVAGSLNIKKLHKQFTDRLDKVLAGKFVIIVGDAAGADTAIQTYLFDHGAEAVEVYCSGPQPRNNIGQWTTHPVPSNAAPGSRDFYTAKDKVMAAQANYGLMIWDTKSTGTLSNVIELLKAGKKSVIFVNKNKSFMTVKSVDDLNDLISYMSYAARQKADSKIHLTHQLSKLQRIQLDLAL